MTDAPDDRGTRPASVSTVVLPNRLDACSMARAWARERLQDVALDQRATDDVILCLDELVSNVVTHTLSKPTVTITVNEGVLVEVGDTSREPAAIRIRPGEPGLWGLRIVDNIAERWGCVLHDHGGKTVWFTIAP